MWFLLSAALASPCPQPGPPLLLTRVTRAVVDESSGLAPSARRPGWWFTHNDSGGKPEVYAFDGEGGFEVHAVQGADAVDWEDLDAGPCPGGEGRCLYVADIGDNKRKRAHVTVYAVPEPGPGEQASVPARWDFTYAHGPDNAETLLVHPQTGALTVVTKSGSGRSHVVPLPRVPPQGVVTLQAVGTLDFIGDSGSDRKATGGAWSPDGSAVAIRTYTQIWEWAGGATWWTVPPRRSAPTAVEVQGEALHWHPDGGWVTTSEGTPMPVHHHRCPAR